MRTTTVISPSRAKCAFIGLCLTALSGACQRPVSNQDDNWTYSGAVMRGQVTRSDGSPVGGSAVVVVVERPTSGTPCRNLTPSEGFTTSAVTATDGRFIVTVQGGPFVEYVGCLSVHVRSPVGAGLTDIAHSAPTSSSTRRHVSIVAERLVCRVLTRTFCSARSLSAAGSPS